MFSCDLLPIPRRPLIYDVVNFKWMLTVSTIVTMCTDLRCVYSIRLQFQLKSTFVVSSVCQLFGCEFETTSVIHILSSDWNLQHCNRATSSVTNRSKKVQFSCSTQSAQSIDISFSTAFPSFDLANVYWFQHLLCAHNETAATRFASTRHCPRTSHRAIFHHITLYDFCSELWLLWRLLIVFQLLQINRKSSALSHAHVEGFAIIPSRKIQVRTAQYTTCTFVPPFKWLTMNNMTEMSIDTSMTMVANALQIWANHSQPSGWWIKRASGTNLYEQYVAGFFPSLHTKIRD